MRVAFFLDYDIPIVRREGITTYVGYLLEALLSNYSELEVEVWVHTFNKTNFKNEYADIISKYSDRLFVYSQSDCNLSLAGNEIVHFIKYEIYKYACYIARFVKNKHFEEIFGYRAAYQHGLHEIKKNCDLALCYDKTSEAEVAFVPYPGLAECTKVKTPCVVQIHDLFTFPLLNLFNRECFPRANFKKSNNRIRSILYKYSKKRSIFVCSTEYTRDTQITKYINGITVDMCRVIPFPPLYKRFDEMSQSSISKFKEKYGICDPYIAFPSQNRPNKNVILLLRALKLLREKGYELVLVTTGSMRNCNSTSHFVKENPGIVKEIKEVSVEELNCLYSGSELVVCPNIIEGLGISGQCLEALTVGKPVVHVKSMGMEESLERVGLSFESANLQWVDIDDYEELAEKIIYVLNHKEKVYIEQKKVLDAYNSVTWREVADGYMKVFEELKGKA